METTDYCSYELSKAPKAAGFDEPCDHYYARRGIIGDSFRLYDAYSGMEHQNSKYSTASAPTLWQAQKWLREKHHISVRVSYISYHKVWFADWLNLDSGEFDDTDATFDSYEEALADGITAALELIKKGE